MTHAARVKKQQIFTPLIQWTMQRKANEQKTVNEMEK